MGQPIAKWIAVLLSITACTSEDATGDSPMEVQTNGTTSGPSTLPNSPSGQQTPAAIPSTPQSTPPSVSSPAAPTETAIPSNDGAGGSGAGGTTAAPTPPAPTNTGSAGAGGSPTNEAAGGNGGSGGNPSAAGGGDGRGGNGGSATEAQGGAAGTGGMDGTGIDRPARVLLYSFSTLNIPSVPAQLTILSQHLQEWGYEVDESVDPGVFTDESLTQYAAVGMINTCFSPFGEGNNGQAEGEVLQRFLQDGGGLFGTHCADVTFQSANPPALYNELLGGRASSQNFEGSNQCRKMEEHPTTAGLPDTFEYVGNLDGTDFIADDSTILVRCQWGDQNNTDVAVSWVRNEGPGRVFFTNFGKVDIDLTNATVGDPHIIAGLEWVLGL